METVSISRSEYDELVQTNQTRGKAIERQAKHLGEMRKDLKQAIEVLKEVKSLFDVMVEVEGDLDEESKTFGEDDFKKFTKAQLKANEIINNFRGI